jgi:hypothetical protein
MFEITLTKTGPTPKLVQRELNSIQREAARTMGQVWATRFRQKHFRNAASGEYGYTPRQGEAGRPGRRGFAQSYTGKKLKKYGHSRPLVLTGESEEATRNPRIEATATRGQAKVRVIMNSPGFNRRYAGSPIDMRQELTTVSEREGQELAHEAGFFIQFVFSKFRAQSTHKVAA